MIVSNGSEFFFYAQNPYQSQIDCIMMGKSHKIFLSDARSYSRLETPTDHRLVKAKIEFKIKVLDETTENYEKTRIRDKLFNSTFHIF